MVDIDPTYGRLFHRCAKVKTKDQPGGSTPSQYAIPTGATAPEFLRRAAELLEERGKEYDSDDGEGRQSRSSTSTPAIHSRSLTGGLSSRSLRTFGSSRLRGFIGTAARMESLMQR